MALLSGALVRTARCFATLAAPGGRRATVRLSADAAVAAGIGPKVFFPNFTFTMVRSAKEHGPKTAVFRVPMILNKMDIKAYLEGLYGVTVTDVQTRIFLPSTTRQGRSYTPGRKNAIVTMTKAFAYPPPPPPEKLKNPLPETNVYPSVH